MPKNIVLCLDGTGNQIKATRNTNVVLLHDMLDLSDPSRQIAFYDPGVGTFAARGALTPWARKFTRILGLAIGYGIKDNLAVAYTFLVNNYEPGDRVYVFGFSRGAFTARALIGLTHLAGVLRRGSENLVSYLIAIYTRGGDFTKNQGWETMDQYETFVQTHEGERSMPVHYLGLWDTVKALGYFRPDPRWPYTRALPNVRTVRHAVSIDEKRRPYHEYLLETHEQTDATEAWFAGVHSDVGGTFGDDKHLSTITLKWVVEGALDAGLLVDRDRCAEACAVTEDFALGEVHHMGRIWELATYRHRPVPPDALVHDSVRLRMQQMDYSIKPPRSDPRWIDKDWTEPYAFGATKGRTR